MASGTLAEVEVERGLWATGQGAAATGSIPVVDLSAPDGVVAAEIMRAASEVGFFTVANHGIPEGVIERAFRASAGFFAQPKEAKEAQMPWRRDLNSGYEHFAQVRPSTGLADQKESLQITAREGAMAGGWPRVDEFEPAATELLARAHALAQRILSLLEPVACAHLEPGTLARAHTTWGPAGQCTLRMLHYPPVERPEAVPEGYWRAGPHTDWCCVTLLFQQVGEPGLECAPNPRAGGGGGWLKVRARAASSGPTLKLWRARTPPQAPSRAAGVTRAADGPSPLRRSTPCRAGSASTWATCSCAGATRPSSPTCTACACRPPRRRARRARASRSPSSRRRTRTRSFGARGTRTSPRATIFSVACAPTTPRRREHLLAGVSTSSPSVTLTA